MKKTVKLTESDLVRLVRKVTNEQTLGDTNNKGSKKFVMPIDIIISGNDKKVTIPKGTAFVWDPTRKVASANLNGQVITYNPMENGIEPSDSCSIDFMAGNRMMSWQWSDCIFGIVYKPDYLQVAKKFHPFFSNL